MARGDDSSIQLRPGAATNLAGECRGNRVIRGSHSGLAEFVGVVVERAVRLRVLVIVLVVRGVRVLSWNILCVMCAFVCVPALIREVADEVLDVLFSEWFVGLFRLSVFVVLVRVACTNALVVSGVVRNIVWYNDSKVIVKRLVLIAGPERVDEGHDFLLR